MAFFRGVAVSLLFTARSLHIRSSTPALLQDAQNPVSKVVSLLEDMKTKLEAEASEDEAIYDKLACWCATNDKDKTGAIAAAQQHIEGLQHMIEGSSATSGRLNAEISQLEKEIQKNEEDLNTAAAQREKQLAAFSGEESDLLESINALGLALDVLSKHHGGALVQVPSHIIGVAATVAHELQVHASRLNGLSHSQRQAVALFIQSPEDYFNAKPTFKQAYAPQSGEIYGILKQMKETFEKDLADTRQQESTSQESYAGLKAAKAAEIAAGKEQLESRQQQLADTDEEVSQAKQDVEDTKSSLSTDEQFLMNLKEKCSLTDHEWEQRQKDRQTELQAVSKAIATLHSDEARDAFSRTLSPSLLQESDLSSTARRSEASRFLLGVAQKFRSQSLIALASSVRSDPFTEVKKAIDDMVGQLLVQQKEEVTHRDWCISGLNTNERSVAENTNDQDKTVAEITSLQNHVQKLTEETAALTEEISNLQVQLKRFSEDRSAASIQFQATVTDQRQTQDVLRKALAILQGVYGTTLVQRQAPPPGFKEYKKNSAGAGVLTLIQQIIADAKAMETEALAAEHEAQQAYEQFVTATNDSIKEKQSSIIHKTEEKARDEVSLSQESTALEGFKKERADLDSTQAAMQKSCDFVMRNFEIRQSAREEEISALKQAKAILSGAKYD